MQWWKLCHQSIKSVMFQPHKVVVQGAPRNAKRFTILVLQEFQQPHAQARVFDHLAIPTTTLHPKTSAMQIKVASHLEVGTSDITKK